VQVQSCIIEYSFIAYFHVNRMKGALTASGAQLEPASRITVIFNVCNNRHPLTNSEFIYCSVCPNFLLR
jgi:hypothetical protein